MDSQDLLRFFLSMNKFRDSQIANWLFRKASFRSKSQVGQSAARGSITCMFPCWRECREATEGGVKTYLALTPETSQLVFSFLEKDNRKRAFTQKSMPHWHHLLPSVSITKFFPKWNPYTKNRFKQLIMQPLVMVYEET